MEYNFYINLSNRVDKRKKVEDQLRSFGIDHPNRFDAIHDTLGPLGATKSHCAVVKLAKERNWPYVFVFEDDVIFLDPLFSREQAIKMIHMERKWDVICLGGNNYQPYTRINENLVKVTNLQVSIAYIVHADHYDTFISHLEEGILLLEKTRRTDLYIIDIYWKILQRKYDYFVITPLVITQDDGYSDNTKRHYSRAFFDKCMLDLK